ncbi:bacteriocin immunity protein [Pseudomonas capeferrum]|uniref:bacteriocin immunity protein n=1 Tax=Pseudomonas capeferrum TaxID=1495066 RepID=UPI0015E48A99|nr:bacteriocin immunity protein [Pseudomonas capeferrum]MBA1202160.1 bacteriocin immunity protein [Pseudomonas capeferrum]
MVKLWGKFEKYTEDEFAELVQDIWFVNVESKARHDELLSHFEKVSEHPQGSDLIYYPLKGEDSSPAGIVQSVKAWRAANGKPGFRAG